MLPEFFSRSGYNKLPLRLFLRVFLGKVFLLVLLLFSSGLLLAQRDQAGGSRRGSRIIDDTTKQIYGPNTSRWYTEEDAFFNRPLIYPIDTVSQNFHRFTYVQRFNNLYQDLGNIGTAIRPIYYQNPTVIGVRSGFDAYDLYWDTQQIRYYDTKSPYSNMHVILGGKGRSITRGTYSRNVNPRWNIGLTYRGFFIDKQVPERRSKGDRITRSNYYDFFTSFATKDSTYRIFSNFRRMFHRVAEFGGAKVRGADSSFREYFDPNVKIWLTDAESNDMRMNFHFSHAFKVGKALTAYHTFDRYRAKSKYMSVLTAADRPFYNYIIHDLDTTRDISKFKVVRNEAGLKGNIGKLFYNGYYAIRHFNMTNYHPVGTDDVAVDSLDDVVIKGDERYFGGRMELYIDSVGLVNGWVEVNNNDQYRIEGNMVSKWFDASVSQMKYRPTFQQQRYIGSYHEWDTAFADVESSQLRGNIHYRSRVLRLSPGITLTRLKNYVFFDSVTNVDTVQQVYPIQSGGNQTIFSPQLQMSLTFFRHITLSNMVIYTSLFENADDAIRVPELFVNTQLSYSNIHFNGNLDMHAGVDIHWKSAYFAPAYSPALRQYFNQDSFEVQSFPLIDIFFNAKIKRGRVFVKLNNVVQLARQTGYFTTPFYPGQRNVIDFGFDWSFYD